MEINGRECTIYAILNIVTQERYIGSTVNFKNRKKSHWSELRLKKHGSWKMQRAYSHWGESNFRFITLETFYADLPSEIYAKEQFWIDLYQPEYNVNMTAGSFIPGSARTAEARKKSQRAKVGRIQSQEEKDKRAESLRKHWALPEFKGTKKISEKQREQMRINSTGANNPNWGLHRSEESKKKTSISNSKILYTFCSPDGKEVQVTGLYSNAESVLGISYGAARNLFRSLTATHKGWTFVKSEKIK